jgi:hypothetical protein
MLRQVEARLEGKTKLLLIGEQRITHVEIREENIAWAAWYESNDKPVLRESVYSVSMVGLCCVDDESKSYVKGLENV